jgi:hypothetical protein
VESPVLLEVTWHDTYFDFDQPHEPRFDYLVRTVGYVVSETPTYLSVAAELLPDGDGFRAITHVHRASIHSRVVLERLP